MSISLPLTRRQRDILEFLKDYVDRQGISPTLEEIAEHFGVNKVTVFGHVAEMERKGVLKRRARGVSRGLEIVDQESDEANGAPSLPVLGKIAAGAPIETIEEPEQLDLGALIPEGRDVYALEVTGTSMIEDAIADGDIVLIERRDGPNETVAVCPTGKRPSSASTAKKGASGSSPRTRPWSRSTRTTWRFVAWSAASCAVLSRAPPPLSRLRAGLPAGDSGYHAGHVRRPDDARGPAAASSRRNRSSSSSSGRSSSSS